MKQLFSEKLLIAGAVVVCLLSSRPVVAQLTITNGAQFVITGNLQLTLSNTDLVNNGSFLPGAGTLAFTGSSTAIIKGNPGTPFFNLQINKSAGGNVVLQNSIGVGGQINFVSGLLDLNGFDADLGSTGSLNGEQETSHVVGVNGGMVLSTGMLNAPAAVNLGNLGILITSAQNLGSTVIRRGNQSQTSGSGSGSSVLRYYDIQPANNTALNATLRMRYMEEELNGLDESSLVIWEKQAAQGWGVLGEDSRDITADYVEKTGIQTLGRITLSSPSAPLPVQFVQFEAQCNGSSVLLNWKTAQEENSHYYSVERSADATQWIAIGNVAAAGNATGVTAYSFTDNSPIGNGYYRVAEYDLDGKAQYSNVLQTACGSQDVFKIWPNPVSDRLYISLTAAGGEAILKLFDGKGALVRVQQASLQRGSNLLNIDVEGLSAGVYYVAVQYNNKQFPLQKVIKK
ncbi:MAG TPA: T9SS type A sorting domain-containing protein [Puia sp.]|nr:T9SS type A sorting domain-containing protein [Puia sp.]